MTCVKADENSMRALKQIVKVLYNYCPGNCWGSREAYKDWVLSGGVRQIALERVA